MRKEDEFLDAIKMQLSYWKTLPGLSVQQRLRGLVFSVLVEIDGEGTSQGYELNGLKDKQDIAGGLHEIWSKEVAQEPHT